MDKRERAFRLTAVVTVALMSWGLVLGFRDGSEELFGGDIYIRVASVVLLVVFSTYAVLGPKKANRLLARLLQLHELPETLWQKWAGRHIEMPSLEDEEPPPTIEGDSE